MAFCLNACFGQVFRQDRIKVFSRLGGNYLGDIKVPSKTLSAFKQLRFLQEEVARLCPHPKRTCEDLLLYVGQEQVGPPGMAYLDDLDEEASLQVQTLLKGCTRLEMMWDEDDAYARSKVEQAGILFWYENHNGVNVVVSRPDLPKELGYIVKQGKTQWYMFHNTGPTMCVDFSNFKMRYASSLEVERLTLANITATNYMHCNVKHLSVTASGIDCKSFAGMDKIESLVLCEFKHSQGPHVERNFKELAKLPNLKDLHLNYQLVTPQGASELLDAMALMPHVMVTSGYGEDYRAQDVRVALRNMQLGQIVEPPKHMFANHRLVATTLGCIALGMAIAVGVTALRLGWTYLKAIFS